MLNETVESPASGAHNLNLRFLDSAPLRILALLTLLTAAAVYTSFSLAPLLNGDIWWHLSSGIWMVQNHAVPRTGLFSQYADRPWVDTSWGFDVITALAYKLLGLRAFVVLLMVFKVALAWVTFLLAGGWRGNFWGAIVLSAVAQCAIVDLLPLPILFSIFFFGLELLLLLRSRQNGNVRPLYWLPLLFLFWANLHGQFLVGLVLLGLFLAAEVAESLLHSFGAGSFSPPLHPLAKVITIAGLSAAATLVTPYPLQLLNNALQAAYA